MQRKQLFILLSNEKSGYEILTTEIFLLKQNIFLKGMGKCRNNAFLSLKRRQQNVALTYRDAFLKVTSSYCDIYLEYIVIYTPHISPQLRKDFMTGTKQWREIYV